MNKSGSNTVFLKEMSLELLAQGKSLRVKPNGYSMFPAIRSGDEVVITPVNDHSDLKPGDIVVLERENDFVLHRLIGRRITNDEIFFITRGDSSLNEDRPLSADKIIALVKIIEGKRGKITPNRKKIHYYRNHLIVKTINLWDRLNRLIRIKP